LCVLGILGVCTLEGAINTYYPRQFRWDVYRHPTAYVRELRRVSSFDRSLGTLTWPANGGSAFELFQIDSLMTFNPGRIFEFYRRYFHGIYGTFLTGCPQLPSEAVLDRANIRYFVLRNDVPAPVQEAERRSYTLRFHDDGIRLYERPSLPRYFFTSDYRVVPSARALELAGSDLPAKEIVLEGPISFPSRANQPEDPAVEIESFRRNSYSLRVRAPRQGLVYCSESFFDGWSATVNGKPTRILPANYAFRAIEVPSGTVTIRLSYWPPGLTLGLAVSAAGLLAVAWVGAAKVVSPRKDLLEKYV
jgi:hypothetical protein